MTVLAATTDWLKEHAAEGARIGYDDGAAASRPTSAWEGSPRGLPSQTTTVRRGVTAAQVGG